MKSALFISEIEIEKAKTLLKSFESGLSKQNGTSNAELWSAKRGTVLPTDYLL
jgi:hypothetical protein